MGKLRPAILELAELVLTCPARQLSLDRVEAILESEARLSLAETRALRRLARIGLFSADWGVRSTAAELLTDLGAVEDRFALEMALRDPEWVVRCSAASSLGLGLGKATFALLRSRASDPHPIVRRYIYVAMFDADAAKAVPWLRQQLASEHADEARIGLLTVLAEGGDEDVVQELRAFLEHPSSSLRNLAEEALDQLSSPESL